MKELTVGFSVRNGRIEIQLADGRCAIAIRKTAGMPWMIIDPWGSWTMHGTRGEVVCDMKKRIQTFHAVEQQVEEEKAGKQASRSA